MKRDGTLVKLEENTGKCEEPVLRATPGSQSHLNPLPAVRLCNTFEFSEFSSQAAGLGTLPIHLQVQRGQHRLRRLVYTDPQEMLSLPPLPIYCYASWSPPVDYFNVLMWNPGKTKVQEGYKPFLCDLTHKTNPFTSSVLL